MLYRARDETGAEVLHSHVGELSGDPLRILAGSGLRSLAAQAHNLGTRDWRVAPYRFFSRRWTLSYATRLLAVSAEAGRRLAGRSGREYTVIPVGLNLNEWQPDGIARKETRSQLGIEENQSLILHVGRFDPVKNHKFSLNIAAALKRRGFPAKLLFVGGGPTLERTKRTSESAGLNDAVEFLGPRDDVKELMNAADLLILPSLSEGTPRVLLEAAEIGLPFIATANADLEGLFAPGCRMPVNHAADWADGIISRLEGGAAASKPLMDLSIKRAVDDTFASYD